MKFAELLKKWNKGIVRGSQLRLAKTIGVDTGTVSRWVNGTLMPGEDLRPRIAKELGITVETLMDSLGVHTGPTKSVPTIGGGSAIDQLTRQLALLQETCGAMKDRLHAIMKRKASLGDFWPRRKVLTQSAALRHKTPQFKTISPISPQ